MDLQNERGMDEVWNPKDELGPIRDGDRFNPIDLCAYSVPGNSYDRARLRGHHGHAHGPKRRCAAGC